MMLTGIGGVLSCAHEPINADIFGGEVHGHSYEVVAWFENEDGADLRMFATSLFAMLKTMDHKTLPPELATMEAIARRVGLLNKCVQVDVNRPLERYYARWTPTAIVAGARSAETAQHGSGRRPPERAEGIAQQGVDHG